MSSMFKGKKKKKTPWSTTSNNVALLGNQNINYRVLATAIRDKVDIVDLWSQADSEGVKQDFKDCQILPTTGCSVLFFFSVFWK